LATDSLTLLSHAFELGHKALFTTYGALLDLRIWGSIIGMFELNNLGVTAQGPVNFELQDAARTAVSSILERVLKTQARAGNKDEWEDIWALEGNGFYVLHSCINHSCRPNCKVGLPSGAGNNSKGGYE